MLCWVQGWVVLQLLISFSLWRTGYGSPLVVAPSTSTGRVPATGNSIRLTDIAAPAPHNVTTTNNTVSLGMPPPFHLAITYAAGTTLPAIDLAAEVFLSWNYYLENMGGRHGSLFRFEGYTLRGNYKDMHMLTRFHEVDDLPWEQRPKFTNREAAQAAREVYEVLMRDWETRKWVCGGVEWVVQMDDRAPTKPETVIARGWIEREGQRESERK